jgi:prepilin-type N-terminal cleavage/methylation domain-containing protein
MESERKAVGYEGGFTLIELLIVVAIIGTFLMLAVPNYKGAVASAQTKNCQVNQRIILTALEAYAIDNNNEYPTAATALSVLEEKGYLHQKPQCPSGGGYTIEIVDKKVKVKCSKDEHNYPK